MTQEQSFAALAQVVARAQGAKVAVNVSLSSVVSGLFRADK
jgi:hydroxymethylglutaryl-CoA lyase